MSSWSGLYDGEHGQSYAAMPKADALPPFQRGIVRVLMQNRAMHGHVTALGRNAPSFISRVNADRQDIQTRGAYDYANRQEGTPYDMTNAQVHSDGAFISVAEGIARPADATETDMLHTYDTTLRNGHPADAAANGATSPEVSEIISDGT